MAAADNSSGDKPDAVAALEKGTTQSVASSPALQLATSVPSFPLDSEYKCKVFKPWTLQRPHHLVFHLAWISFFTCQFSTFSAAALAPVIRDNLNLTREDINAAGIAATSGSILSRLAMGWLCDTLGPRRALSLFLGLISPAVICTSMVTNASGLIVARFFVGLSLGAFVTTQFCSSVMFNVRIVGLTNAAAAGWGNMGGGLAQLVMPAIYTGIAGSVPAFTAWRWSFFVPGGLMMLMSAVFITFAQDLPRGNYRDLVASGQIKVNKSGGSTAKYALRNYRTWLLAASYALSFGVELTVNNIIVSYIADQFEKDILTAGGVGSIFGLMNLISRAMGGLASDTMARAFGIRGRLWLLFLFQTTAGGFCIGLGYLNENFPGTLACLVLFALSAQLAEGTTFSIVPFVSKRALGGVSGVVGAGGNVGSVILQAAFFYKGVLTTYQGITYMGYLIVAVTVLVVPCIHFPMWGSMLRGPTEGCDEMRYYLAEYTPEEVAAGFADASQRFAKEAQSQRGTRSITGSKTGSVLGSKSGSRNGSMHGANNQPIKKMGSDEAANGSSHGGDLVELKPW